MNSGVQYYRAPFPEQHHWDGDFARIKASGLNTAQLWVLWGWVEAKPDTFNFDDYDRLIDLADKHGLGVILSSIAELQPLWIHRLVPGSEMIDHEGKKVSSPPIVANATSGSPRVAAPIIPASGNACSGF